MATVPSPCTGVCRIEPKTGWCLGCRRTMDEIAGWRDMSEAGRRAVVAQLGEREPVRT
ncbi:DUF1289 domain-containing protein [Novosphingobium album (ex Hu et al. 2023)]|uniref:DUF1289 domain-containing protein n=1 Tax=Novosphingobium album (ex Hu et al. 2023) TaxID=2930093 RepID=A0ABT0B742_9SPHN|nr:DUF1289 domain-containing protein [Novosphingobium album (ex Hu et al. 2023)]MCJ2180691.1 DUF1289 domain-containing protein [Novosphingobium album (ex Hu et al. 2023)]